MNLAMIEGKATNEANMAKQYNTAKMPVKKSLIFKNYETHE